jgi:hypothetical protein
MKCYSRHEKACGVFTRSCGNHPGNWVVVRFARSLCVLFAIILVGCFQANPPLAKKQSSPSPEASESPERLRFEDHTEASRIKFSYRSGAEPTHAPILQEMGGGCGLLDLDGDGCLDVFVPGGGSISDSEPRPFPHGLFQNLGAGIFRDVSTSSGLMTGRFYSQGVASSDYDADGFPDLLVTGYGGLQLFHNQGDGTFADQAESAGLTDCLWSTSAAWGDVNQDGHLDLYLCHYVDWSPKNDPLCAGPTAAQPESCPPGHFKGLPDTLYLSTGRGTFQDISKAAGLQDDGKGLGVVLVDLDADGDLDIYVANDAVGNFLYRNQGTDSEGMPHFLEIGTVSGSSLSDSGTADGSMGIAVLDLNQDSRPDLWVSNFEYESPGLYRNEGDANFTHIARIAGLESRSSSFVSFGTVAADFDGDRDDDVFVANGHVSRFPSSGVVRQPCQLFENLGRSQFREVADRAGACLHKSHLGRGLAVGDFDGDGDPDILLSPKDENVQLFRNTQSVASQWLTVHMVGTTSPRDGKGSAVTLVHGGTRTKIWSYGGGSYLSSSSSWLSLPLEPAFGNLEFELVWPSGKLQRLSRDMTSGTPGWTVDCGEFRKLTGTGLVIIEPLSKK